MGASGASRRGKYTFVSSDALPTRLPAASVTELAKKSQITDPESASSAYGAPPSTRPRKRPKKSVKTTMYMTGWSTAQTTPSSVCL